MLINNYVRVLDEWFVICEQNENILLHVCVSRVKIIASPKIYKKLLIYTRYYTLNECTKCI